MSNFLYIPFINPINYTEVDFANVEQYISKHMDDFPFTETIMPWEQQTRFFQPWQISDSIRQQITTTYGPVALNVLDCQGNTVYSTTFQQKQQDANNPGNYIYESDLALNIFTAGTYFLQIVAGSPAQKTLISEPLIFAETIENSLLIEFSHFEFYNDVIFETGIDMNVRIYGGLKFKAPNAKDTLYEDQSLNMTMLKSVPYRLWRLVIGNAEGIPDWFIDKLNRVLGCSTVSIDGRNYSKNEGAKMEESTEENYPMRAWAIELREKLNRDSKIFSSTGNTNQPVSAVVSVETKGFVLNDNGGSYYQIEDVN